MHRFRLLLLFVYLFCFSIFCQAEKIALSPDHPQRYTVVKGDTLWDIAARFLQHPWQWPTIWKANPQIKNPHWIYPGDTLVLDYVAGQPVIRLQNGMSATGTEKLRPQIRSTPLEKAIPTIPYEVVRQFLTSPKVVTSKEIESAPYIVSLSNNRLIGGTGDSIYVRRLEDTVDGNARHSFTVFRQDDSLKDWETKEVLGYNALYVADSHLERSGDPATLLVDRSVREILVGDRLLPVSEEELALDYYPHRAPETVRGHIIKVLDGVSQIGQYNLVVIDRGTRDGLEKGHVMQIWRHTQQVLDTVRKRGTEWVSLPDEKAGFLMVFRPFERVSYGIILKASQAIHIGDLVTAPEL